MRVNTRYINFIRGTSDGVYACFGITESYRINFIRGTSDGVYACFGITESYRINFIRGTSDGVYACFGITESYRINFIRGTSDGVYACFGITESYRRRLKSLLLCLCDVFRALINSLVCWFCTSALGLFLFQIVCTAHAALCWYRALALSPRPVQQWVGRQTWRLETNNGAVRFAAV